MAKIDKLTEQASTHLESGENILAVIQGVYETKIMGSETVRNGIFLATDKRVVFYAKKMGGFDLESFPYRSISSFEHKKSLMGHGISFFASGNEVRMKWINDGNAVNEFVSTVRGHLHGASTAASSASMPQAPSTNEDIAGKIRQLSELHEAGILSDEEFATKKAELLSRM